MSETRSYKVLSCVNCRQRKVKCDKIQPICTHCGRSGLECIYPTRKPTRRLPKPRKNELFERISRLESIVVKADAARLVDLDSPLPDPGPGLSGSRPRPRNVNGQPLIMIKQDRSPSEIHTETSPTEDAAAGYLSKEFWGNLCEEVEGIKQALDQPSDEDEEDEESYGVATPDSTEATLKIVHSSGYLHGSPAYHEQGEINHPSPPTILRLWTLYLRNVDPLLKFLHRPTLGDEIESFAEGSLRTPLAASKNALLFCIYFAAVSTLTEEDCLNEFGESKSHLACQYRMNAERALAAADYLSNTTLVDVQAVAIYVTTLRCYSLSRATWILTAMVIRLAQGLNLHRDGDGRRFTPFEGEQRRRLWYYLTVLDIRGAEDRGTDAILTGSSYNTIRPTNIDDDDFGPETTEPLVPKATPAENVIGVCTSRCSVLGHITHPPHTKCLDDKSSLHTEEELVDHIIALERDFIHQADAQILNSRYASEITRFVILKIYLVVQYPFTPQPTVHPIPTSRETMLHIALSVIELVDRMTGAPWAKCFSWWTGCFVQWHPLAVALAELCVQTEKNELTDRAWALVERVFPKWRETVADSSKGPLWRPIRKLYKKAKEAKEARMMEDLRLTDSFQPATPVRVPQQPLPSIGGPPGMGLYPPTMCQPPVFADMNSFDTSMMMDPSMLFHREYPPDLSGLQPPPQVDFVMTNDLAYNNSMAHWNEFILDAQTNYSPDGSGQCGQMHEYD